MSGALLPELWQEIAEQMPSAGDARRLFRIDRAASTARMPKKFRREGVTKMLRALEGGALEKAKVVAKWHALRPEDVQSALEGGFWGEVPHFFCGVRKGGSLSALKWLFETFRLEPSPAAMEAAVLASCESGALAVAKWLAAKAPPTRACLERGLDLAATFGHQLVAKWLVEAHGLDISKARLVGDHGYTDYFMEIEREAAVKGVQEMLALAAAPGPRTRPPPETSRRAPAREVGGPSRPPDPRQKQTSLARLARSLDLACAAGDVPLAQQIMETHASTILGAPPSDIRAIRANALVLACVGGHETAARWLVLGGVSGDPRTCLQAGEILAALEAAGASENIFLARWLCEALRALTGEPVLLADIRRAFCAACALGQKKMVRWYIQRFDLFSPARRGGAPFWICRDPGLTAPALEAARRGGHESILLLLKSFLGERA
jgi:hypothetical protein